MSLQVVDSDLPVPVAEVLECVALPNAAAICRAAPAMLVPSEPG